MEGVTEARTDLTEQCERPDSKAEPPKGVAESLPRSQLGVTRHRGREKKGSGDGTHAGVAKRSVSVCITSNAGNGSVISSHPSRKRLLIGTDLGPHRLGTRGQCILVPQKVRATPGSRMEASAWG